MKLEFIADGADNRPLIRLYDFDVTGAMRLREAFRCLSTGSRQNIPLHDEWWIEPVEGCRLTLRLGPRGLGVVQRLPLDFECALTADTWTRIASMVDPFCAPREGEIFQWLNEDGEVSLLLSPNGKW